MRNIYIVNATQVVTSESHPEGLFSVMSGYPKTYDSRNYDATAENPNGNEEKALNSAKSEYFSRLSAISVFDTGYFAEPSVSGGMKSVSIPVVSSEFILMLSDSVKICFSFWL